MKKKMSMLLAIGLAASMLASCSNAKTDEPANDEVVLKVGSVGEPNSLDPEAFNFYAEIGYDFYDTLLVFGQDGSTLEPAIAESWKQIDDVTYEYKIREGVKFSNGDELTMEDVLYSMERVNDNQYSMSYLFAGVESFSIDEDAWTLTVKLTEPDCTWQYTPATSTCTIVNKEVCEAEGESYGTREGSVVGTGPYKYVSWNAGSEIVYEKNEYWWGDASTLDIDRIEYYIMEDSNTIALALKSGAIDFAANLSDVDLDLATSSGASITHNTATSTRYVAMNTEIAPFDDVNARKAFAYCIDSEAITTQIAGKYATKLPTVSISKAMKYMDEKAWDDLFAGLEDYTVQDYDKAREYLAKSNYPDGFSFDIYSTPARVTQCELMQSMCAEIGIEMNIIKILDSEGFTYFYGYNANEDGTRPYQALTAGSSADYLDPAGQLKTIYHGDNKATGCLNSAMWENEEFDALIDKTFLTTDNTERMEYFLDATKIASEECPYINLYEVDVYYGISKDFAFVPSPQNFWNFRYANFDYIGE